MAIYMLKEVRNICYLVVGGGGGGNGTIGYYGQGGGGGGEVLEGVAELTSLSYQVVVGCGGEGQCCTSYTGCETNNGGPSYIGNVICAQGGFSGKGHRNGGNSGSGCIGGCNRTSCCCNGAGGGAGAGGNGGCAYYSSSVGNYGGCGGVGISSCIEGTEKWYGGGGGGYGYNCQGLGCHGGGNGASETTYGYSYAGTNGTGGGGGGGIYVKGYDCPACNKKFPCDGGSGLVVIAYPANGSYGFSSATGGDCCYECNGMCIHKFCTDGTFSIVS